MNLKLVTYITGLGLLLVGAPPPAAAEAEYTVRLERSHRLVMRDGVILSTDLYFPEGAKGRLPVILVRTPYNKNLIHRAEDSDARFFAAHGYVVAVQDKRGKFESGGLYVISGGDNEDGYDTITWLAEQPWSNGKIGTYGCSYLGEIQVRQATLRHPNLAAMVPQAAGGGVGSVAGKYRYFALRNGGAFELAMGVGWFPAAASKVRYLPPAGLSREEFLEIADRFSTGPMEPKAWAAPRELWSSLPIVDIMKRAKALPNDWVDNVSRKVGDPWWDQFGYLSDGDRISAPALHVNSWYDYGAADTLFTARYFSEHAVNEAARDHQYVIMSPTTHCQTDRIIAPTMAGDRDLGDARLDTRAIYLRWFDRWLRGNERALEGLPKVQYYLMGKNEWRGSEVWPPAGSQPVNYYLHSDGRANSRQGTGVLSTAKPGNEPPDRYVYDPATAVPTLGGPVCCTGGGALEGAFDQREIEMRHDVLVYSTPPLETGVEVTGPLTLVLYVSSSAKDTDFTGKLVDVYPDGRAFNVQEGIRRARTREGLDREVFMEKGGVYEVRVDLQATANYFGPGHQIRIEVSSSNFPRFDRNLNTGGNNYGESEWVTAENTIHHSKQYPSRLILWLAAKR